ncbi:MAG: hypothetical protein SV375_14650 [Thermodesulfobacteriota bacterium]|nr:hypothetical protein [Thermodesulfobacteriota bacterium]
MIDLYGYSINDPVNFLDPLGLMSPFGRIVRAGVIGAIQGAIIGGVVGAPAMGIGGVAGALAGGIMGLANGLLIGTILEITGVNERIENLADSVIDRVTNGEEDIPPLIDREKDKSPCR